MSDSKRKTGAKAESNISQVPPPDSTEETEQNYTLRAVEFRRVLAQEAEKPIEERNFPDESEWVGLRAVAVCETPGCVSEGLEFVVNLWENSDGIYRILCGPCGNNVDDVTPLFSEGRGAMLQTRFSNGTAPVSRDPQYKNKNTGKFGHKGPNDVKSDDRSDVRSDNTDLRPNRGNSQ